MTNEHLGYILAELLKHNTQLHDKALMRKGRSLQWPKEGRKVMIRELSHYPLNASLKSFSGLMWNWLKLEPITTRQIYALLLQWALRLTDKGLLVFHTSEYESIFEGIRIALEKGADGEVDDIQSAEIIEEWEFMRDMYLDELHNKCSLWINNKN